MKKIIFYPSSELVKEVVPPPIKISVPDWYKKISPYEERPWGATKDALHVENNQANLSVKSCMPFFDALTNGYVYTLWTDVQVMKTQDGGRRITWIPKQQELKPIQDSIGVKTIPVPQGHISLYFGWWTHWGIKTPKGYSCLFTHPMNRTDLPFITTTGIIDTDKWGIWGNQPFFLREDFEGIIPAGTPISHVFPFKRDSWKSEIDESGKLTKWANYELVRHDSKIRGYYKNKYWNKKRYE